MDKNKKELTLSIEPPTEEKNELNSILGSFGAGVKDPSKDVSKQFDDSEELVMVDKASKLGSVREEDTKVNFERFSKTKRRKVKEFRPSKGVLGIKIDTWLRNNRTLKFVWLVILAFIIFNLSFSISLITTTTIMQAHKSSTSYFNFSSFNSLMLSGNIFGYIGIVLTIVPFFYLLVTVLVGINDVYRSKQFHYFNSFCLIFSAICVILCISFCSYIIATNNSFQPIPPEPPKPETLSKWINILF